MCSKRLHRYGDENFRVGCASMQGWRDNMEDADIVVLKMPKHQESAFFGVFDGHCGSAASKYCADNMPDYIDGVEDLNDKEAITQKIVELDDKFLTSY